MIYFDEISIKEFLGYNIEHDDIEGFEDFGATGKAKYVCQSCCCLHGKGSYL